MIVGGEGEGGSSGNYCGGGSRGGGGARGGRYYPLVGVIAGRGFRRGRGGGVC